MVEHHNAVTAIIAASAMDVGEVPLSRDPAAVAAACRWAAHAWPTIVGFVATAALGAAVLMVAGPSSVALPTVLP